MKWTWRFVTLTLFVGLASSVMAAQPLPMITGDWYYRGTPVCVPCTLRIDKQSPEGEIFGQLYWGNAWTKGSGTVKRDRKGKHVNVKFTLADGSYVELVHKINKKNTPVLVGQRKAYADHGQGWIVEFSRKKPGKK